MDKVTINQTTFVFYDSIKALPIKRFNLLNKFVMQEAGIGSSMADVERHFANMDMFLGLGDLDSVRQERINLHYNFYLALTKISFKSRAFASLIYQINDSPVGDLEDDNEYERIEGLLNASQITQEQVSERLQELKKNLIQN